MSPRPAPGDLRASDADRDRVVNMLNAARADGRLTPDEHDERLHAALSARTLGDLAGLTTDLAAPAGQPIQLDGGRLIGGVFGRENRGGRWVVPSALTVTALAGEVTIDFREALLTDRHTVVYANAVLGSIRLLVPDGVDVTVSGTMVLGRKRGATVSSLPPPPDMPVIEVRAFTLVGEILVKTPPRPRRWLPGPRRRREVRG